MSIHTFLAEMMPPEGVVVDLGCGSGRTLAAVVDRRPGVDLVGVDQDLTGLAQAGLALDATRSGCPGLIRADLSQPLPFGDGYADAVICHNVLELLPDPAGLLREVLRIVKPGGRAVLSHTDFEHIVIHGADRTLTHLICQAYANLPQLWMSHLDPQMPYRIPGLARQCGLTVEGFTAHTTTATALAGHAASRVEEIATAVRGHIRDGRIDLANVHVDLWVDQLNRAAEAGLFAFMETALVTVVTIPPGSSVDRAAGFYPVMVAGSNPARGTNTGPLLTPGCPVHAPPVRGVQCPLRTVDVADLPPNVDLAVVVGE